MAELLGLVSKTSSNAPADWVIGSAISIIFILLVAIPAGALNARERKRRLHEQGRSEARPERPE